MHFYTLKSPFFIVFGLCLHFIIQFYERCQKTKKKSADFVFCPISRNFAANFD